MGPVESAIRQRLAPGQSLRTSQGAAFEIARIDSRGVALLFGASRTPTRLSWSCLEGVLPYLDGRGWVRIGGAYDVAGDVGTLDGYLKRHIKRATAGWVAVLLEEAGVVDVDRARPAQVKKV